MDTTILDMIKKFLPIAVQELQLKSLPKMKPVHGLTDGDHPSFGRYVPELNAIEFAVEHRHPIDILRTLAHELVHCKQREDERLKHDSGETGSDEENEANARAGIIMRNFDDAYPDFFAEKPLSITESELTLRQPDNSKQKAWIEKVYAKYPHTMQNNHVMVWGEGEDQQFAMFELVPSMSRRNAVEVKWFQAYPLRQGVGTRAMAELQQLAREDGIALTLFPWDKGQVSQAKLTKFYKGTGFKPSLKGSKTMHWDPQELEEETDYAKTNVAYHDSLCPIAFEDGILIPEVRTKLLQIAKVFIDYLDLPNLSISDIVLTGSLANYNYTKYSDFDIHVVTDYTDLNCDELAEALFKAKKQIWNDKHDITVRGHEAEMYVEDLNNPPVSAGVYSIIEDRWLKEPTHQNPEIDTSAINAKVKDLVEKIDMTIAHADEPEDIRLILEKLYRMRRGGLDAGGEFSVENLAYKVLRNIGYIDRLYDAYVNKQDADLSMTE